METRGVTLEYGDYGIQAQGAAWLNSRQIESGRRAITGYAKRQGRVFIRVFPDKPVTAKPPEQGMGKGKGSVDRYVFPVRPGRIIFEVSGMPEDVAREALRRAGHKLPFKIKIVSRTF